MWLGPDEIGVFVTDCIGGFAAIVYQTLGGKRCKGTVTTAKARDPWEAAYLGVKETLDLDCACSVCHDIYGEPQHEDGLRLVR